MHTHAWRAGPGPAPGHHDDRAARFGGPGVVRDFRPEDLRQVVAIDEVAMKGFMMTRLGSAFMSQYYTIIATYPRCIFLVAELPGGALGGFAAGYMWPKEFESHVAMANHKLLAAALPALLRRPIAASRLARGTKRSEADEWTDATVDPARCELAAIAVHPGTARRGIGRSLATAFIKRAVDMDADEIRLTSAANNEVANRFYHSLGFQIARVLEPGSKHESREYRLAPLRNT